jgi:hypothetical protein
VSRAAITVLRLVLAGMAWRDWTGRDRRLEAEAHVQFSVVERGLRDPHLAKVRRWADVLGYDLALVKREGGSP